MFLSFFMLVSGMNAQEQDWYDMMHDPNAIFTETVEAFESWWGERPITKGSGYKQFQRWKFYMETRVAPDGTQSGPVRTLEEFERYLQELQGQRKRNSPAGNWHGMGPANLPSNGTTQPNGVGRVAAIAFHPDEPATIYAGSPAGGFHISTDYGSTWVNSSEGLTRLGISSIIVHPNNPGVIYIGTGDRDGGDAPGHGVWYSTDGGATWSPRNNGMGDKTVYEILMHPNNPDILIASTNGRIYRSTDGGANWTISFIGHNCKDLAFSPGNPDYIFATGSKVYRSIDNGQTFTQLTAGTPSGASRIALATSSSAPNNVYLFAGNNSTGFIGFYRSTDNGNNFSLQSNTPNILGYEVNGGVGSQAWYDMVAFADPDDPDHIYTGAINIWETFDGGQTWSIVSHWYGDGGNPEIHADQHVMEISPHTGDLFFGHDGGIHYSTDQGASFTEISSGLDNAQVYRIGLCQTDRNFIINGYQDNGTAIYDNGMWRTEIGGDGMECIVDQENNDILYGALYYGDIRRSTDRGFTFSSIVSGISENGAWVTPYLLHPQDPDTMVAGMENVWLSENVRTGTPPSWTRISDFQGSGKCRDLTFAPSDPSVLYVARDGANNFYRCDDIFAPSPVWTNLDANLPGSGFPIDIAVNPDDPDHLWIAVDNDIFESLDGGENWTDYSGTLPDIPLNAIVIDQRSPNNAMYVGMDVGVYYRDDVMGDWMLFSDGLPNAEILELEIYYDATCEDRDVLRAATYGRGLWESDLCDPGNIAPVVCFDASLYDPVEGEVLTLFDRSSYNPTSWNWQVSPPNVTFTGGTSSTSQNPKIKFSVDGVYTVSLIASNTSGTDTLVQTSFIEVQSSATPLPFTDDFEAQGACGTNDDCGYTTCNLTGGWLNMENGYEDHIDWRSDSGGTPTSDTGPDVDFVPGSSVGKYLYLEASDACQYQTALLVSPALDLGGIDEAELTFAYHMFGSDIGELHIDLYFNGDWIEDIAPPIIGGQGNAWQLYTVSLNDYVGSVVRIGFRGVTGPGAASDIAIDAVEVSRVCDLVVTSAAEFGNGSLKDIVECAEDGDTILLSAILNKDTIYLDNGPVLLEKHLVIKSEPGITVTFSAENSTRAFEISEGIFSELRGMEIICGTAVLGRGILNAGILRLASILIRDNPGHPGTGHTLMNTGELHIEDSVTLEK